MWSQHLRTIVPVCLVAVILAGVVRSGDVHTSLTLQVTDGERNLRCRTQALEEINLDAVSREDVGNTLSKHTTIVTAVVTYYY